jgi:hypothetical protein
MTGRFDCITETLSKEKPMLRGILSTIASGSFALIFILGTAAQAQAQNAKAPYPWRRLTNT